jgi:hypothetical protein
MPPFKYWLQEMRPFMTDEDLSHWLVDHVLPVIVIRDRTGIP